MRWRRHRAGSGASHDKGLWLVLLLLLVVILVPTAGLLWFMNKAVENERLAVRQKLAAAYRGHLFIVQERLADYWKEKAAALEKIAGETPASAAFAHAVRAGLADSVICIDARGQLLYPGLPEVPKSYPGGQAAAWQEAGRLEYGQRDLVAAANAYGAIARSAADREVAARALQAQARCLVRAEQTGAAVKLVSETLGQARYRQVADLQGRLIVADAELMALQLIGSSGHPSHLAVAERLKQRLEDYSNPVLPSAQRRFIMKEMRSLPLPPGQKEFPTLEAEELAARYLESPSQLSREPVLRRSLLPGVWQLASPSGRMLALFKEQNLILGMRSVMGALGAPSEVTVDLTTPAEEPVGEKTFRSVSAGPHLPGWHLALSVNDEQALPATAHKQIAAHLWIGTLVIAAMSMVALLIAGMIRRQMRLTRLRNDLVATVTHELKTPLSSMRLLVDTLLDDAQPDRQKVREYLELIAKENTRLSRLIDNFLAFSRMERNKHAFEFRRIEASEVVGAAVEAVRERFSVQGCRFDVDLAPDLPHLVADPDALVTVVLNLLDNAYKYAGADKHIVLRAYAEQGNVCFQVEDNGVGLSPRDAKKVFKRFYQVDQSLSRTSGGVGLGLSIVEFIVAAHGGRVRVTSRLGHGSKFTVSIPCVPARSPAQEEALA
jgi:signal transduction histidine kinase